MPSFFAPIVDVLRHPDTDVPCALVLRATHYKTHTCPLWGFATAFGALDLTEARTDPQRGALSTGKHSNERTVGFAAEMAAKGTEDEDNEELGRRAEWPDRERIVLVEHPRGGPGILWGIANAYESIPSAGLEESLENDMERWALLARTFHEHQAEVGPQSQPAEHHERTDGTDPWWMGDSWETEDPTHWWLRPGVRSTIAVWYDATFYLYTRDPVVEHLVRRLHAALDNDSLVIGMYSAPCASIFARDLTPYLVTRGGLFLGDGALLTDPIERVLPIPADLIPDSEAGLDLTRILAEEPGYVGGQEVHVARSGFAALQDALAATGIVARLAAANCAYETLTPMWTHYPMGHYAMATSYPIVVSLDSGVDDVNSGTFSIEDLDAWTRGEGPILNPRGSLTGQLEDAAAARRAWEAERRVRDGVEPVVTEEDEIAELDEAARAADAEVATYDPAASHFGEFMRERMERDNNGLIPSQMDVAVDRLGLLWKHAGVATPAPAEAALHEAFAVAEQSRLRLALLLAPRDDGIEEGWRSLALSEGRDEFWTCSLGSWNHPYARLHEISSMFGDEKRWPRYRAGMDMVTARQAGIERIANAIKTCDKHRRFFDYAHLLKEDGLHELLAAFEAACDGAPTRTAGPVVLLWSTEANDPLFADWATKVPDVPMVRVAPLTLADAQHWLTQIHPVFAEAERAVGADAMASMLRSVMYDPDRAGPSYYDIEDVVDTYARCFWKIHGVATPLGWDVVAWSRMLVARMVAGDRRADLLAWARGEHRQGAFVPGGGHMFGLNPNHAAFQALTDAFREHEKEEEDDGWSPEKDAEDEDD